MPHIYSLLLLTRFFLVTQTFKNQAYQTFFDLGDTNNIHASIDQLMSFGARVILIATKDEELSSRVLIIAAQAGHLNHETVWLTMSNVKDHLISNIQVYNSIISNRLRNVTMPLQFESAVQKLAWTTNDLELLNYTACFAGGIFTFEQQLDLHGYPPFDTFIQKTNQTM
jgi:hypothetical protein